MSRSFLSGLRGRLVLLVILAVLPAFSLTLFTGWRGRQLQLAGVSENTVRLARHLADDQERLLEGTRQILADLAGMPEVRAGDPARSKIFFALLMKQYPGYSSLSVSDPAGNVRFSLPATQGLVNLSGRPWFRRAVETKDFSVGEFQVGQLSGRHILVAAYPALDENHEVVAVLAAGLDVAWLNQLASAQPLPAGAVLELVDRGGTVVARYPEQRQAIGRPLAEAGVAARMARVAEETVEYTADDRVTRIYAFTPIRGRVETGLRLVVGVPRDLAYAAVSDEENRHLWAIALGAGLTLLVAWWSAQRLVLRPVAALLDATRRLAAGDPAARTSLPEGHGELSHLARAFDEMASALESRQQERDRAEQALRESEARVRTFMDHSPAMTFVKDEDGRFLYANTAFERYFELSRDQWFGRTDADLWPGEAAERFRRDDLRVLKTNEPLRIVELVPHPSGREGRWLTVKFPIVDGRGQRLIAGMSLDLTEGHEVREALGRIERRYAQLFEEASDGVVALAGDGRVLSANRAACTITGFDQASLAGQRLEELFLDGPEPALSAGGGDGGAARSVERWLRRGDGGQVLAEISSTPSDEGGTLAFLRDVTARHAVEKALRESEERYRRLYQYLPLAYQSLAEDGTIVHVNDAWGALTGYPVKNAAGASFDRLLVPSSVARFERGFVELLENGTVRGLEVTLARRNRPAAVVSMDGRLGADAHGRRLAHFILHDVTAAREAERRLRVSEERARTLFAESPVALWEQDCSGIRRHLDRLQELGVQDLEAHFAAHPEELADCLAAIAIVDVNKATLTLFGAEQRSEVLGGAQLVRGLDGQAIFAQAILALARGEHAWQGEGTNYTLAGEAIQVALRWILVPGSEQSWSRVLVSALDVTDRIRAEEELREWERRFELAFRTNPAIIGISVLRDGRYLEVNDAFLRAFGYERDEVIGRTSLELGLWSSARERDEMLQRFRADGGLTNVDVHFRTRSGATVTCVCSAVPLRIRQEGCLLVQAVDVSEQRRAVADGTESQRMLQTLLSNLPGMAYRCCNDPEWTMLFVSEGCEALTGYSADDLVGNRRVSYASLILEEDRETVGKAVRDALQAGEPFRVSYRIRCADGSTKWVWEQGRGLQGSAADAETIEGFITDVSERKRTEEELLSRDEELRQAQKMEAVGRLAGGIAHDFNNLLTAILGYAEMVLHHVDAESDIGTRVDEIRKAGERAARLTRQLLAFSRKQVLSPEVFSLDRVIDEMTPMLQRLIGEHIELVVTHGGPGFILADRTQVEQVILNLAVNARDAMPKGGRLTIETRLVVQPETGPSPWGLPRSGKFAMMSISDTGSGMDAQTKAKLFEPFFTTKEAGRGTGLGLSTVYGIVRQSEGEIRVESEPGAGSTFQVFLPIAAPPPPSPAPAPTTRLEGVFGTERILLVEDETAVRGLIRAVLERYGYTVVEAADGEEGLRVFEREAAQLDLLLTDVIMPRLDGPSLARAIREHHATLPMIFLTGHADDMLHREDADWSDVPLLQKPFTSSALLKLVRRALDDRAGQIG